MEESSTTVKNVRTLLESPREPERVSVGTLIDTLRDIFSVLTDEEYIVSIDETARIIGENGVFIGEPVPIRDLFVLFSDSLLPSLGDNVRSNTRKTYAARDVMDPNRKSRFRELRVSWRLDKKAQTIQMVIEDDGVGFSPDIIAAGRFVEALTSWNTEKTRVTGTGFGMAALADQAGDYKARIIPTNRTHREGDVEIIDGATLIVEFKYT